MTPVCIDIPSRKLVCADCKHANAGDRCFCVKCGFNLVNKTIIHMLLQRRESRLLKF